MKKVLLLIASLLTVISLSGCGEKTTGDKVDDALDSAKESSKNAWDEVKKAAGKE